MHFFNKSAFIILFSTLFSFLLSAELPHSFNDLTPHTFIRTVPHIKKNIAPQTIRIDIPEFPNAHNPSLISFDEGYLLIFRIRPNHKEEPWVSQIGVLRLDGNLNKISQPELLQLRDPSSSIPSQAEDARVFTCNGKIYLIYNDNEKEICRSIQTSRRDMYVAELTYDDGRFLVSKPIKLIHPEKYPIQTCQKNWVPFEWNNTILLGYSISPHEILLPNLETGECTTFQNTKSAIPWKWGDLRGGTPAVLMDGEYISFFHSGKFSRSHATNQKKKRHYFMGVYTFSSDPPFKITKSTPFPLADNTFYTNSDFHMRVVFPSGIVVTDDQIIISYGKDDHEVWIAIFDKTFIKTLLKPVK